jgi:hypothetical protein
MTTQEDVLEVLELLPVWQLRAPVVLPEKQLHANATSIHPVEVDIKQTTDAIEAHVMDANIGLTNLDTENTEVDSAYEKPLSCIAENTAPNFSDALQDVTQEIRQETTQYLVDYYQVGDYLFLTAATTRSEAVMSLLRNMLRAMRLTLPTAQSMYLSALATTEAKVVIVMGMMLSHTLLDEQTAFASLRGKVHMLNAKPLIVTYDAQYLLDNPQDKPQAWADLCLAMQTLNDLT